MSADVRLPVLAVLLSLALLDAAPVRAEPTLTVLPLGFPVTAFRGPGSRVAQTLASTDGFRESRPPLTGPLVAVWGQGGGAALTLGGDAIEIRLPRRGGGDFGALERGRNAIPASRVAVAGALTVALEDPTREYPHEALGSAVQAGTLVVSERRPAPPTSEPKPVQTDTARIAAGPDAVFEDREPRLVDLDGDGAPEILVVRSHRERGSALAVVARRAGTWRIVAETPPDGEAFRWLNPVMPAPPGASASLRPGEIALVRRPHLDGVLQLWRLAGDRLSLVAEKAGYSNHAYGETGQDLAAIHAGPGGATRLAIPSLDRRALAILEASAPFAEIARIALPARAKTGVAVLGRDRNQHILVGLEDGRVVDIRP